MLLCSLRSWLSFSLRSVKLKHVKSYQTKVKRLILGGSQVLNVLETDINDDKHSFYVDVVQGMTIKIDPICKFESIFLINVEENHWPLSSETNKIIASSCTVSSWKKRKGFTQKRQPQPARDATFLSYHYSSQTFGDKQSYSYRKHCNDDNIIIVPCLEK